MTSKAKNRTYAMSRRRRNTILFACFALTALLICLDHSPLRDYWRPQPKTERQLSSNDFEKYHQKTFTVVNVVDGDTIDIALPDGKYENTRIRLWGVDTPETKNPNTPVMYYGPEASDFAKELVFQKQVTIYLEQDSTRGKYGRLLAYVKMPDGRFLNEILISEGFAYADLRFGHSFFHRYVQLEAAARSQKKGLWRNVTRDELPAWLQREKPNLLAEK